MPTLSSLRINRQGQEGTSGLDSSGVLALAGAGVDVYSTLDSLPMSNLTAGAKALVTEVSRLYLTDGNGWYNVQMSGGLTPYWDSGGEPDATYTIVDSATPLIITARAADSDTANLINQSFGSDSAQYMASVTNDSSVFTFTPKSADSIGIEVGAGNLTDSNGDFIYTFKWSDGINFVSKAVTITYNVVGGGVSLNMYGDRGVHWTGRPSSASYSNIIDYIDISTPGDATDFGDYTSGTTRHMSGGASNGSRGVFHGGALSGGQTNELHYITFASPGNSTDFGDLNNNTDNTAGSSDETRGLFWHGRNNRSNIDYIAIATLGNATDFGSATYTDHETGAISGPTRNVGFGGYTTANNNSIEYVTVQTLASATDFGDTSVDISEADGAGDATRGIIALGTTYTSTGLSQTYINNLEYITFASPGNSTDFGDLTVGRGSSMCNSNGTTMTIAGGLSPITNTIDSVTIQTPGNAADFGDLTVGRFYGGAASGNAA